MTTLRSLPVHILLAAVLLLLAVVLRIADPEPVGRLRLAVFDSYLGARAPRRVDPALPVRIVDIDDASLAAAWASGRGRARASPAASSASSRQAGARTVSLDLILAEPDRLSPGEFAKLFAEHAAAGAARSGRRLQLPSNDRSPGRRDRRRARCASASPARRGRR